MKMLGVIGGIAPGSTIDYYRLLVATWRDRTQDGSYPSILINSIDLTRMLRYIGTGRTDELTAYLRAEVERLARAGAQVGLLASNTPHLVFEELSRVSTIPLLSIVEAACDAARELRVQTVGLLGTRFTMEGRFYPDVFARHGIRVLAPDPADIAYVHEKYMGELVPGDFRASTREGFAAVIARLKAAGSEAVLLAGTELPLLLRDAGDTEVPLLDTTAIHVRRAVEELLA
jgi:aspartate racemase